MLQDVTKGMQLAFLVNNVYQAESTILATIQLF